MRYEHNNNKTTFRTLCLLADQLRIEQDLRGTETSSTNLRGRREEGGGRREGGWKEYWHQDEARETETNIIQEKEEEEKKKEPSG